MSHYKEKILALVIILYAGYFYYQYVNFNVYPQHQQQSGEWVREWVNPLTVVFIGRLAASEDGSYTSYDAAGRASYLLYSILAIVLTTGLVNYFRSKGNGALKAFFMIELWKNISLFVFTFFYYAWNKAHPEVDLLSYHRDFVTVAHGIYFSMILSGIFILRNLSLPPTADASPDSSANFQGMRGFHFLVDRLLLLVLGNNFFIFLYRYREVHLEDAGLWIWITLSFEGALIVCYFLCEKLIGTTPGKILTGTRVGNASNPNGRVTTAAILKRTVSRLIPFDSLSFLSISGGWHDRFSETTVYYAADGQWLKRQNRIVMIMFSILPVLAAWFLFSWLTRVELMHCRDCADSGKLPLYLGMILLPVAMLLFTGWLASVTRYAMNLSSRSYPSSNSIYAVMASWWIPIYNFGILNDTMTPMLEAWEASGISPEAIQKLKRGAATLRTCFVLFYLFIFCALLSIKVINDWSAMDAILLCLSLGVVCWSIGTLKFCAALRFASINN